MTPNKKEELRMKRRKEVAVSSNSLELVEAVESVEAQTRHCQAVEEQA